MLINAYLSDGRLGDTSRELSFDETLSLSIWSLQSQMKYLIQINNTTVLITVSRLHTPVIEQFLVLCQIITIGPVIVYGIRPIYWLHHVRRLNHVLLHHARFDDAI